MQINVYVFILYIIIESFDPLNRWCNSHLTTKRNGITMETEVERKGKGVKNDLKGGKLKNKRQVEDSKKNQKTEYDNTYTPPPPPFLIALHFATNNN